MKKFWASLDREEKELVVLLGICILIILPVFIWAILSCGIPKNVG